MMVKAGAYGLWYGLPAGLLRQAEISLHKKAIRNPSTYVVGAPYHNRDEIFSRKNNKQRTNEKNTAHGEWLLFS